MSKKFPSAISYYGAKGRLAKYLISLFPSDYVTNPYVEVFGGSGAVLFLKEKSNCEVYNDVEDGIVNFFRVVRDHGPELQHLLNFTPYSLTEHTRCCQSWRTEINEVEKARQYFVAVMQSYGKAEGDTWAFRTDGRGTGFRSKIRSIPEAMDRLKDVYIENRDFRILLEKWNKRNVFLFLDPPYVASSRTRHGEAYIHECTDSDHSDLLRLCNESSARIMISGYHSKLYDDALTSPKWNYVEKIIQSIPAIVGKKSRGAGCSTRTEVMWRNYVNESTPVETDMFTK